MCGLQISVSAFHENRRAEFTTLPFQPLTKLPPSEPTHSLYIFGIFLEAQPAKP